MLQELIRRQAGLVTYRQLRADGLSEEQIRHRIGYQHWIQVLPRVIAVHNGPLDRRAELHAALLYGGDHALLSHQTAAQDWKISWGTDTPDVVHITVPYTCSAISQPKSTVHPGVAVHRSRAIEHLAAHGTQRKTTLTATIVDLATAQPTPREAGLALIEAVTNASIDLRMILAHIEKRRPWRYADEICKALELLRSGVQSALEHRYVLDVEQAHGLPTGTRQSPVIVNGRTLYEDVDYAEHGVPLIVRLDGQVHQLRERRTRDRERDNAAELADRPRLTFGWHDVVRDPCAVSHDVLHVLRREGWQGEVRSCSRCSGYVSGYR